MGNSDNPQSRDPKVEMKRVEKLINSPESRDLRSRTKETHGRVTPRNASTMILIDGKGKNARVLMGKRNPKLKFMPGALVFPGGSVDRYDGSMVSADELNNPTRQKLISGMRGKATNRGARALGLAAIREMAEETGILLGKSGDHNKPIHADWIDFQTRQIVPTLSNLRLFSRAITPPGMSRRFDTWFFVTTADEIGYVPKEGFAPSGELEGLQWIKPEDALGHETREITRVMLAELTKRLEKDPKLDPEFKAPYYYAHRGEFKRELM